MKIKDCLFETEKLREKNKDLAKCLEAEKEKVRQLRELIKKIGEKEQPGCPICGSREYKRISHHNGIFVSGGRNITYYNICY